MNPTVALVVGMLLGGLYVMLLVHLTVRRARRNEKGPPRG